MLQCAVTQPVSLLAHDICLNQEQLRNTLVSDSTLPSTNMAALLSLLQNVTHCVGMFTYLSITTRSTGIHNEARTTKCLCFDSFLIPFLFPWTYTYFPCFTAHCYSDCSQTAFCNQVPGRLQPVPHRKSGLWNNCRYSNNSAFTFR